MKGYKPYSYKLNFKNPKVLDEYFRRLSQGTDDPVRCMDGTIFIEGGPDDWVDKETHLESIGYM
jgi:hypothetical protein